MATRASLAATKAARCGLARLTRSVPFGHTVHLGHLGHPVPAAGYSAPANHHHNRVCCRLHAPSPMRRLRPSHRRCCYQRHLCKSRRAARFLPCRRSTAPVQGPRLGPEGVPVAGGRAGGVGFHSALSRTGGPLQSSQYSRRLADFLLILYPRVSTWPGVL
jgi:hypothetical protein